MSTATRTLSILLCLLLVLTLLPGISSNASAEASVGACGPNLTWTFDPEEAVLTVTGEGPMDDYVIWTESPEGQEGCLDLSQVKALVLEDGVTSVGVSAFNGFVSLERVIIPSSVEIIHESAFNGCLALNDLTITEGTSHIDSYAFGDCFSLTSVQIPASVADISPNAFSGSYHLSEIGVDPMNLRYGSLDGVLFSKDFQALCIYPENHGSVYSIPGGTERIGASAFAGNASITEVMIPDTVTSIGDGAFFNCCALRELLLPEGLTEIGTGAFAMSGLTELTVPDSVSSIGPHAFEACFDLESIALPEGISTIEEGTFSNCESIKSVTLPDSITKIDAYAFEKCSSMRYVILPEHLTEIDDMAFQYCASLINIVLPESMNTVGYRALYHCPSLLYAVIPASVQSLGSEAFGYQYDGQQQMPVKDFAIFGYPNTEAQSYADRNGLLFMDLSENQVPSCSHQFEKGVCNLCGYAAVSASEVFSDVEAGAYYDQSVLWALQGGTTAGTGDGLFLPLLPCTREQVLTFLYAAKGKPAPKRTGNAFLDVQDDKYYFDAVMWATENGITSGVKASSFGVGLECTREQAVMFLWKSQGSPEPTGSDSPFSDVQPDKYYSKAVLWAVENHITSGIGNGRFGVGQICTRAQIVTFLYRVNFLLANNHP